MDLSSTGHKSPLKDQRRRDRDGATDRWTDSQTLIKSRPVATKKGGEELAGEPFEGWGGARRRWPLGENYGIESYAIERDF